MGSDLYFFEQCETRKIPRRYRKLPEELPESLRFAHLNPKVAALLASKDRGQRVDSEDPFGDGLGKKSLLPDINAAFQNVRNQFDSNLSNDEDSQRYLFEEAKLSATAILHQLAQIIYRYEDLFKLIPKSLEYHLMSGYNEFTSDIVVVPREWQTQDMKEQYAAKLQQQENAVSEEEYSDNEITTGRTKSRVGTDRSGSDLKTVMTKRSRPKLGAIDASDESDYLLKPESRQGRRTDSRMSSTSFFRQHLGVESMSRVGSRRKGSSMFLSNLCFSFQYIYYFTLLDLHLMFKIMSQSYFYLFHRLVLCSHVVHDTNITFISYNVFFFVFDNLCRSVSLLQNFDFQ